MESDPPASRRASPTLSTLRVPHVFQMHPIPTTYLHDDLLNEFQMYPIQTYLVNLLCRVRGGRVRPPSSLSATHDGFNKITSVFRTGAGQTQLFYQRSALVWDAFHVNTIPCRSTPIA